MAHPNVAESWDTVQTGKKIIHPLKILQLSKASIAPKRTSLWASFLIRICSIRITSWDFRLKRVGLKQQRDKNNNQPAIDISFF